MKKPSNIIKLTPILIACSLVLTGCKTTEVRRVDANQEVALSDKWNGKDSQLVSEAMINDMLSFPWVRDHLAKEGTRPAIIIQSVRNKSHQHIAVDTFLNDLKRSILRSGQADFVASADLRGEIRNERKDQELNASLETQNEMGQEQGADYALSGTINSFVDEQGGSRVTFYQVDLRLIDMTTNREVWNGQKKIQKVQERSSYGF
ncbi:penicillin-binding protein activator LpoB [Pseudoalteromonas citrea]|uniref:Penicillin-binding protein activator LpoB n=2 Tax=Pseudoalteromonas TaxID=53246 RepID=A0A5S3V8W9_9GAMM|nr:MULTISPECIES: penicillin-binding protein activator LpoB [Pseudoalteromonas]RJE78099.1 penicillin-binding protein activator LpoB [Pseudoalteromonas sp. MSK9-3]TMO68327.1 penicillin-binding protein activator LpoB [Pseudoalteromonas aurantia]TMO70846.1 penicillin-binding protein activator LpoB [Pseudoalteromonas aurantia]TMP40740.1 penicillin-binding protein activator LpoB [Pseudoalteromonas citrea]TMP54900.1 penicillin-binding protein activator LpoB [Pseudoalteromonas citrea]